ncbi:hypothetical protein Z950_1733 [Sulfitobacter mediterraneus KCTC 32188]|nr:hypothetical protein Z950_1733 [Sulfitobacter mediterraneus KCTC 32188]
MPDYQLSDIREIDGVWKGPWGLDRQNRSHLVEDRVARIDLYSCHE